MAKVVKKVAEATTKKYVPYVISPNHSIAPLRTKVGATTEDTKYPLGKWLFPVAICHGSRTENAYARVDQVSKGKGVVLNHPDNIANAADKTRSKGLFQQYEVPTTLYLHMAAMLKAGKFTLANMMLNYPIVAKLRNGSGGVGMTLIQNQDELSAWRKKIKTEDLQKYFFEEVFNWNGSLENHFKTTREYRISVSPVLFSKEVVYKDNPTNRINGLIVALRKLMKNEAVKEGHFGRNLALGHSSFVREFATEYDYGKRGIQMNFEDGIAHALQAVRALGLDYGAVDILWSSTTGNWCVIEVNTAPAMGDPEEGQTYTLDSWRTAFRAMIQEKHEQQVEQSL